MTLWQGVLDAAGDDAPAREAALSVVGHLMLLIEVGSTVAAEGYLEAQQRELADSDRVRRDLLEDLLARRDPAPASKQTLLRAAGLDPGASLLVVSAAAVMPVADEHVLPRAAAAIRAARAGAEGLAVVRQQEIVAVLPVSPRGPTTTVANLRRAVTDLQRQRVPLAVGISPVHAGLTEVPEAYAEAVVARDGLGDRPGVIALPVLSSFDYLMLRDDETARRLVRPRLRRFVEEDAARGGALIATLAEYVACDLNAKTAARRLHLHVNTAYYRLDRIAERTGCDLRSFADVLELLIAVRLLGARPGESS
jgi:sugar diacid utilization regulator